LLVRVKSAARLTAPTILSNISTYFLWINLTFIFETTYAWKEVALEDQKDVSKAAAGGAAPKKKKKSGARRAVTVVVTIVAILVILGGGIFSYVCYINNSPLPKIDGDLKARGLQDRVEVIRDSYSIPHIYAQNLHDLFFTQGYVQAQDRWWQMDFFRHTCAGKIEELTGKKSSLVSADIYLRTMGWRTVAEKEYSSYTPAQRAILDSFAEGVNAYISGRSPQELSVNYSILALTGVKFKIEPWTPVDTLAFGKLMSWDLGYSGDEEIQRSQLYTVLGSEMADRWQTPPWGFGSRPTILDADDVKAMDTSAGTGIKTGSTKQTDEMAVSGQSFTNTKPDLEWLMGDPAGIGSNNWVATGSMTQSGKPLLANDPHLGIQMPSIWYEIGLHAADDGNGQPFDVAGFSFAPSPGVIVGHNRDIAWGVTNVYADVHDHYQIRVNPDNPLQYEWNGSWRDMTVRDERINFGDGSSPIAIKVRQTHFGPIINDNKFDSKTGQFFGFNNKDPLALRWTALEPGTLTVAIQGLNQAKNWDDFRNALKYWDVPSQNIIYADRQGNIGYQMPGKIPVRAKNHSGLLPAPGWTDEYEWKGYILYDLLPRIYNPSRGYVITANQAVVPPEYYNLLEKKIDPDFNYNLGYEWNFGYRAQRINDLMKQLAPHTIESYEKMQGDSKLLAVGEVLPYLANIKFSDRALTSAVDWLVNWDYTFNEDSPQAALYSEFWMRLVNNVVQSKLGDIIKSEGDDRDMWAINLLLQTPNDKWWDDPATKDKVETRDDMLAKSFKEGYEATVAALGPDRSLWKWGKLHTATFVSNPLGASGIGPIESLVNRGPVPASGTTDTVNACRWTADKGNFAVRTCPSMRMIIDMSDISKSVSMNLTGESGHPASQWYGDLINSWRNVKYHPMLWTRQQVNEGAAHNLTLAP
jgi:penicillin G amidase